LERPGSAISNTKIGTTIHVRQQESKRRRIERGFSTGLWAEIRKPAEIRQPEPRKPDFGHPEEQLSGLHKLTSRERKNWTGALPSVDSTKIATPT